MRHLTRLIVLACLGALAAWPAVSSASSVRGGVQGSVRTGPTQPVCQAEVPCTAPVADARVMFVRDDVVHGVRTDAHGRYSIRLAPGRYAVRVAGVERASYGPLSVRVLRGRMSVKDVVIDTGIR